MSCRVRGANSSLQLLNDHRLPTKRRLVLLDMLMLLRLPLPSRATIRLLLPVRRPMVRQVMAFQLLLRAAMLT